MNLHRPQAQTQSASQPQLSRQVRADLEDPLLTLNEVATMLKLPPATLRKWRMEGKGPHAFRMGKWLRYRRSNIEAFIRDLEEKELF